MILSSHALAKTGPQSSTAVKRHLLGALTGWTRFGSRSGLSSAFIVSHPALSFTLDALKDRELLCAAADVVSEFLQLSADEAERHVSLFF